MDEVVVEIVGVGLALLGFLAWDRYRLWRQKKRQLNFQPQYDAFLLKHVELYEKLIIPMSESDRRKVARNYNFMLGMFSLFGVLFLFLLFANPPDSPREYLSEITFAGMLALFTWIIWKGKKNLLRVNEKTIVKGVITNKIKEATGRSRHNHYVEISGKEKILIAPGEYRRYSFGDIVKMEILGNLDDLSIKRNISRIGKI